MNGNIYDGRNPAITAWVVKDDPDPDQWTVNIRASILDTYMMITALSTAAIRYAELKKKDHANITYCMAEDLTFQLDRIGGFEAAARIAAASMGDE